MLSFDVAEQDKILGEYSGYAQILGLFISAEFNKNIDTYRDADDFKRGKMAGRIFFETVLIVAPLIKGSQVLAGARGISTAAVAGDVSKSLRLSKWFAELPPDMQKMVDQVLVRVQVTLGAMRDAKWVAYYASDANYAVNAEKIFLMALEKRLQGMKPIDAMKAVEKSLIESKLTFNPKALNAAMMDAVVEEKNILFYVRADGSRVPKTAYIYVNIDHWSMAKIGNGIFPAMDARYCSFDRYEWFQVPRDLMQLPIGNVAQVRMELDTFQAMEKLEVPIGEHMLAADSHLEPLCVDFTKKGWGQGGATQGIIKQVNLELRDVIDLKNNLVIYSRP